MSTLGDNSLDWPDVASSTPQQWTPWFAWWPVIGTDFARKELRIYWLRTVARRYSHRNWAGRVHSHGPIQFIVTQPI
jgi:hypothetical protein